MAFHGIPIGSVWSFLRWLPHFVLRRFFPRARLGELQYVDISPRHESVRLDLGEVPSISIWLQLINLSPFPVELDRAEFELNCLGGVAKVAVLRKQTLEPGAIERLYLNGPISDGCANAISRNRAANVAEAEASLSGHIEFNCKLHPFAKSIHQLSGVLPRLVNDRYRSKKD